MSTCHFCERKNACIVATLAGDPEQRVCIDCHNDPRVPTVELMTHEERLSEMAWNLGVKYGEANRLEDVTTAKMDIAARQEGVYRFFDVFKYGAQSVWRQRGELK